MTSERDPAEVIAAVLGHIPAEMTALRARLVKIAEDSAYLPPEYKYPAWKRLMEALQSSCSVPPALDWERTVSAIVEGGKP